MNSNKNILGITAVSFVLLSVIALIVIGGSYGIYTYVKEQSDESINNNNATGSEDNRQNDVVATWKCSVCGKDIAGNGYEEVSEGVWKPCHEPTRCQICSPECGMKHTRQINSIINDNGTNGNTVCTNCGLGHYNSEGFCTQCGAASSARVNESKSKLPNCELCHGTGVEENTLGEKRKCPACNGTGKVSY